MKTTAHMWAPEVETLSRDEIEAIQGSKLAEQVTHVFDNAPYFRELYEDAGLRPKDVAGLEDLESLPTFNKDDLRAYRERTGDFWCGTLCVPTEQLMLATHSTGTTGKPNFFGLTKDDYDAAAERFARMWFSWGLRRGDIVNTKWRLGWHGFVIAQEEGIRKVGATSIRSDTGTQNIAESIFELQREAEFDALKVYQPEVERKYIESHDIEPLEVFPDLRFIGAGADVSEPKRAFWEELWGVPLRNAYGSGDQFWVFYECGHDPGYYHVPEDHIIVEVLDPETKDPVGPGEPGELYITNLEYEANPYLRYGMEDMVEYDLETCTCGRTTMRIKPLGRYSWCVNVVGRDQPVSTSMVEGVLWRHRELIGKNYQLVETDPDEQSSLHVRIASDEPLEAGVLEATESDLENEFGVPATCTRVAPDDIGLESSIKLERVAREY